MNFTVKKTDFSEILLIEPKIYNDERGFFFESFNKKSFYNLTNLNIDFVQDNHSRSKKDVLRGLHFQLDKPQGKLIRVLDGIILDVIVDIRKSSSNFGKWIAFELSSTNKKQLWIPEGFAHGYLVKSNVAEVLYKTTEYWFPEYEKCIIWDDADISINWPIDNPILSQKDQRGKKLSDSITFK